MKVRNYEQMERQINHFEKENRELKNKEQHLFNLEREIDNLKKHNETLIIDLRQRNEAVNKGYENLQI